MEHLKTKLIIFLAAANICCCVKLNAQDLESILDQTHPAEPQLVTATFKSGKVINFQSPEMIKPGNMEFIISHRFGPVNGGSYQLWGLDQSTIRFGFNFGITDKLMVGFGRSSYEKTYDGFLKYALLRQKTGGGSPVSVVLMSSMSVNSLHFADPSRDNFFSSRISYVQELVVARKFNENLSLELIPTWVHNNLVATTQDQNDIPVIGIAGRYKISKRTSINAEYGYRVALNSEAPNLEQYHDTFSIGVDIETGGHVFQIQLTNSLPMVEKGFLTETSESWLDGGIHLGFNITRMFVLKKPQHRGEP